MGCEYGDCEHKSGWCMSDSTKEQCVNYLRRKNEEIRQSSVHHSAYIELLNENNDLCNKIKALEEMSALNVEREVNIPYGLLNKARAKYPSLRLCQLLIFAAKTAGWENDDLFYCSDDTLVKGLEMISE